MADLLTPVSAFLKIAEHSDYAFLLESVEGGEHVGRYSFLGKDPFLVAARPRRARPRSSRRASRTERPEPFLDVLRELMAEFQSPFVPDLPRFTGGAVGYFDYDAAEWFEPAVRSRQAAARSRPGRRSWCSTRCSRSITSSTAFWRSPTRACGRATTCATLYDFACAKIEFLERELERSLSRRAARRRAALDVPRESDARRVRGVGAHDSGRHRRRRDLSGGAVAAVRDDDGRAAVRRLSRAAPHQSVAVHVFHPHGRRTPSSARRRRCSCASKAGTSRRTRSPARGGAARRRRETAAGRGAAQQREGARRARDARRPRPQRRRPRRRRSAACACRSSWRSSGTRTSCTWCRASKGGWPRTATGSTRSWRRFRPAR